MALGQMRMSLDEFESLTPAQFIYAWMGFSELHEQQNRENWERERISIYYNLCAMTDASKLPSIQQILPLPWDEHHEQKQEITAQELRERVAAAREAYEIIKQNEL